MMKVKTVIMAFIWLMFIHTGMVFSMEDVPGAATLISPVDIVEAPRPVFKWSEADNAAWYQLFIRNRSTGEKRVQWYEIEDNFARYPQVTCTSGECQVIPDSDLADSTYDWWVFTWNDVGSQWAGPMAFTVQTDKTLPLKVELISPSGTVGSTPVLTWHKDSHATWYKLYLIDDQNAFTFVQWYQIENNDSRYPQADCAGTQCSITLDTPLAPGVYTWWIKSWNANGAAPWSDAMDFTVPQDAGGNLKKFESSRQLSLFLKQAVEDGATGNYRDKWMFEDVAVAADGGEGDTVYSGTNVQVSGVDELDTIKFDGQHLFVAPVPGGYGVPEDPDAIKIFELSSTQTLEKGRIPLDAHKKNVDGFYLVPASGENDPALLITLGGKASQMWRYWCNPWYWASGETEIVIYDVTDPLSPVKKIDLLFDGDLISSRRINDKLYIVTKFTPTVPGLDPYTQDSDQIKENESLLDDIPLESMLPQLTVDGVEKGSTVTAADCFYSDERPTGEQSTMVTITMIDINDPENRVSKSMVGSTEALFVSTSALYLATTAYDYAMDMGIAAQGQVTTEIHKFKLEESGPAYSASAVVDGHLGWEEDKKSFRMGEYQDVFRIATSQGDSWNGTESTTLTLLKEEGEGPETVLTRTATIEGIGKPGEKLYASRFSGNKAYIVTFRVTDPLYVFDLSDPYSPVTLGELHIDGYSDYLHPIGENMLVGVGKDAVPDDLSSDLGGRGAWYQGVKLSLFDVSDPQRPTEVNSLVIGKRGTNSDLLTDHHALAYLPPTDQRPARLAIPVDLHDMPPMNNYYETGDPRTYYGWTHTGLYLFEVETGDRPGVAAGIKKVGDIIVEQADSSQGYGYGGSSDRALLVDDRVHYIHNANLWSTDWDTEITE